ncbi:hypothetical protein CMI47_14610 [Candidatus Pacearchaeota archaeon]|nr:hypothetical protein [Candidatus Pacearchaeota archaeon]|tara:strand:- start:9414 stop:13082 length:3669 start_codon:yes stop_codon:yes gene_type:complete
MASLLDNANLLPLTSVDQAEVVSLAQLLLGEEKAAALLIKRSAETKATKKSKSGRAGRLSKTKSSSTSSRQKTAAPLQTAEQSRIEKKNQQAERKKLEAYQLQAGKKKKSTTSSPRKIGSSKDASALITETRENSLIIDGTLRPIVFGMLDFLPTLDSTGTKATPIGNILKINRAIKVLNIENLPEDIDTSTQGLLDLEYLETYSQFVSQTKLFLKSLDASNFSILEDAVSFLSLANNSTSEASNTQLLLTILRDYALAVDNCSPRLFEAEEREIPSDGASLPEKPAGITALKEVLKSDKAFDYLDAVLGTDEERALKILLYQISSELKLSYNASKLGINQTAASTLQARLNNNSIMPGKNANINFLGLRSFAQADDGRYTFTFPFEPRDILPDDSGIFFASGPDIAKRLHASTASTVYAEIAATGKSAFSIIAAFLDTGDFASDYAPSVGAFILIIQDVVVPLLNLVAQSSPARKDVVEFLLLVAAGKDQKMLAQLMLFLAALKEELARPAVVSTLKSSSRAKVVGSLASAPNTRTTSTIQSGASATLEEAPSITKVSSFAPTRMVGAVTLSMPTPTRTATKSSTTTVASNVGSTLVAAVASSEVIAETAETSNKLVTTVDLNPSVTTTETTRPALSSGYQDICAATAALLLDYLTSTSTTGSSSPSSTNLTESNVYSSLLSLVTLTTEGDVFITLLTIFDDFIEMFSSPDGSCFSGTSTAYSAISRGNIEIAFFMCITKIQAFAAKKSYTSIANDTTTVSTDVVIDTEKLVDMSEGLTDAFQDEVDLDEISSASDTLGRIVDSLVNEEALVATIPATFSEFLDNASLAFIALQSTLLTDTDESSAALTLQNRVQEGLPVSSDLAMTLGGFVSSYNSDFGAFSGVMTRDPLLSDDALTFFSDMMKEESFSESKKIIAIALPSGLCDALYNIPVSLEDTSRESTTLSSDVFEVQIEKIDLTRPTLKFKEQVFSFPRNVRLKSVSPVDDGEVEVNYSVFDSSLVESAMAEHDILDTDESGVMAASIKNLKISEALKMYVSLLYDVDFSIVNYPIGDTRISELSKKSVGLPFASGVDTSSLSFLSGSNLAFDPDERALASFSWFDSSSSTLDLEIDFGTDVIAFSVWEYLSAIGVIADTDTISDRLALGSKFENILLLPFDPYDFEIADETVGDDAAIENMTNDQLTIAQEEVGIGLETSQGVELSTFRVTITIPEQTAESDDG